MCSYTAFIKKLNWSQKAKYAAAKEKRWNDPNTKEALGYIRSGGGLTRVKVLNAGHMVPYDQPKISYLIKDFVK